MSCRDSHSKARYTTSLGFTLGIVVAAGLLPEPISAQEAHHSQNNSKIKATTEQDSAKENFGELEDLILNQNLEASPEDPATPSTIEDWLIRPLDSDPRTDSTFPWVSDNLRWVIDASSRVTWDGVEGEPRSIHAIGLDLHKVFSGENGDWGTLIAQLYLTRLDRQTPRPFFFEDAHDTELVFRIFNFNYTGLAKRRINFKVGHFDLPYGLEQTINTNGTLRQFSTVANLGLKTDWGFSINGNLPGYEYEIGLTRGSWNEYFDDGDPYVVSGRIGTQRNQNLVLGLSAFRGRVAGASGGDRRRVTDLLSRKQAQRGFVDRWRVGLDIQWYRGSFGLLNETSYGQDSTSGSKRNSVRIVQSLTETNWRFRPDFLAYVQGRASLRLPNRGSSLDATSVLFGVRWTPALVKITSATAWDFSLQAGHSITTFDDSPRGISVSLQFRLRL